MILFKYILRNHLLPFIFSVFTLMSVFLLQFLMKFSDKLIGKGLETIIIVKLITYSLAWMVVLVVPMAVLIATLMAFGTMAQNNEVAILKATGVSLYKMMIPPMAASILLFFLLIQFNNYIYPDANHAARLLMQDISQKKPTLSLSPGVFSQEIPNYSILVRDIDQNSNELKDLTIYDYSDPRSRKIITAEKGKIYFSGDQAKLIMDLENGEIHESNTVEEGQYRKLIFNKHKIAMNAGQFAFQQSNPASGQRGERELGAQDMIVIVDSLERIRDRYYGNLENNIVTNFLPDTLNQSTNPGRTYRYSLRRAEDKLNSARTAINANLDRLRYNKREINKYWVEIHKKYALPFACIVFVLIGAPLGTMTRKGGLGVAAGISLLFFLVYWSFLIAGEKFSDRGLLSPFWGMWSANVLLLVLGITLTIKSAKERVTIEFNFLKNLIPKQFRQRKRYDDENS